MAQVVASRVAVSHLPGVLSGVLAGILASSPTAWTILSELFGRLAVIARPSPGGGLAGGALSVETNAQVELLMKQVDLLTRLLAQSGSTSMDASAMSGQNAKVMAAYAAVLATVALIVRSASNGDKPGDEPHWMDGVWFVTRSMFRRGTAEVQRAVSSVGARLADAKASLEARLAELRGIAESTAEDTSALREEVARIEETLARTENKVDMVLDEQKQSGQGIRLLCGAAAAAFPHSTSVPATEVRVGKALPAPSTASGSPAGALPPVPAAHRHSGRLGIAGVLSE